MDIKGSLILALLFTGLCVGWIFKLDSRVTVLERQNLQLIGLCNQTVDAFEDVTAWVKQHDANRPK